MATSKLRNKRFTLSQVLDFLDLGDSADETCNIVVVPQNEKDAVLSDCDSDGSDMGYEGETGHLPARLLNANPELKQTDHDRNKNFIIDDDLPLTSPHPPSIRPPPPPPSTVDKEEPRGSTHQRSQPEDPRIKLQVVKNKNRVFKHSKRPITAGIPKHPEYSPNPAECVKQSCPSPMDIFLLMYPCTLRELTIKMSNLYSTQTKGKPLNLSMDEVHTFYGVLFTSGYSSVPRRHMYWSLDSDVHNESISDAMRRNRFDEIMASFHVVDNAKITDDPFFKVRPIFSELNQSYKIMPFQEWLLVDESMVPYYGRSGCKQFIKGKPIHFGYKLWSLASSSGYMYHMEPYGGSHTLLPETGLGQGPSVVLGLAEQAQVPQGCKFFHDKF